MKKTIILLIVGIVLFALGGYQNIQYEEHGIVVAATITDIQTTDDSDDGSYKHTYYGEYTVDGKTYTDKKLTTAYTNSIMPDQHIGDTVDITVYPHRPDKKVPEGGLFITVGLVISVCCTVVLIKNRKRKRVAETAQADVKTEETDNGETHHRCR